MANILDSNTSDIVLKTFLKGFMASNVLCKTVDRQLIDGKITPDTGDRIRVKRPHQYRSKRTADGDISALTRNNIVSGTAEATVQDYITVDVEYGQLEEAIQLNQLDQILMPAGEQMVADLEIDLGRFIRENGALFLGTAGTPVSTWGDMAQTGSMLKSIGVADSEKMYAVVSPFMNQNLANSQSGLASGDNKLVDQAWKDAQISTNFGGVRGLMSNVLGQQVTGDYDNGSVVVAAPPIQTYSAARNSYTTTLSLTGGAATGTITPGTVLQFSAAGDLGNRYFVNMKSRQAFPGADGNPVRFTAVVVEGGTAVGGAVSVTITSPIFEADGQYNNISAAIAAGDEVTVISGAAGETNTPNLFYSEQAFGLGTVKLPPLKAQVSKVISNEGFSIRMTAGAEILENKNIVRFDLLPTFACFNPLKAGQFYGVAAP